MRMNIIGHGRFTNYGCPNGNISEWPKDSKARSGAVNISSKGLRVPGNSLEVRWAN